ncbi:MAG: hypothetical protein KAJ19_03315 [Gammaproteobacteria bacterium]|nr:hypothetical protein [Gammaproteobacteria bacterium]
MLMTSAGERIKDMQEIMLFPEMEVGMRFFLVFLVLFMSIGINLPESYIAHLGLEPDYLKAALAAWVITGLIIYRNLALIVLVVSLSVGANLPTEMLESWSIDRDVIMATLIAIVVLPKFFEWME